MNRAKEIEGVKYVLANVCGRKFSTAMLYFSFDMTTFELELYQTLNIMRSSINDKLKHTTYKDITMYRLYHYCNKDVPMVVGSRLIIGRTKDIRMRKTMKRKIDSKMIPFPSKQPSQTP